MKAFFRRLSLAIRAFWVTLWRKPPSAEYDPRLLNFRFMGMPDTPPQTAEEAIELLSKPEMPAAKIAGELADSYQSPPGLIDWHDTTRQGEEYAP
jgi:hypothetical protein